ncbi:MAG: hypothetical protein MUO34_13890, partial [Ignavibacteriaceae bacterium]|nr:hypothetical protein [Ignavibacteriaceae bacterium]
MKHARNFSLRLTFSLALLSVSVISYQLLLIQILSIVQWYHFAYMVISIAMLGFGAAGTFIALFKKHLIKRTDYLLPSLMIISSLLMTVSVWLSQTDFISFDSYLLFADTKHLWKLI